MVSGQREDIHLSMRVQLQLLLTGVKCKNVFKLKEKHTELCLINYEMRNGARGQQIHLKYYNIILFLCETVVLEMEIYKVPVYVICQNWGK
jgi:hypothetical protein